MTLVVGNAMDDRIIEEAISWHAAQMRDDCDWDGFTLWLEADPQHRVAFDDVTLLDDVLVQRRELLAQLLPAETRAIPEAVPNRRARRWAGYGLGTAAAAAIAFSLPMLSTGGSQVAYATGPGQTRMIALADGSRVQLASASRLVVDKGSMTLDGAAWFDVPHDPSRQLTIQAGGYRVSDIGTKFEISAGERSVKVAVAEGTLSVSAGGLAKPVRLSGGQRLLVVGDLNLAEIGSIDRSDVGSWRSGRLVYQNVPLSLVAADISRYAGRKLIVDPKVAGRRFSGVLSIGNGSGLVGDLQQFMGLATRTEGSAVRLVARDYG